VNRLNTLEKRVKYRISRKRGTVFLRSDFDGLSDYDQVGRCLSQLVKKGELLKLGYGVYARAKKSSITGSLMLDANGGFVGASREALDRLKVDWEPTLTERDYNAGLSTQVPVNAAVSIKGKFSRKLSYRGVSLQRAI